MWTPSQPLRFAPGLAYPGEPPTPQNLTAGVVRFKPAEPVTLSADLGPATRGAVHLRRPRPGLAAGALRGARRERGGARLRGEHCEAPARLASFLLSRIVLAAFEVGALLAFGVAAFKVPVNGSGLDLALLVLLASICFGGLGLLISSRARTMEAVSGLSNLVMMPIWVFLGVFFASSNFAPAVQPFVRSLPLTDEQPCQPGWIRTSSGAVMSQRRLTPQGGYTPAA